MESLNAKVDWFGATGEIIVTLQDTEIRLIVDSKRAVVNGKVVNMDVAPTIVNGRTLVPLRFISENLGKQVKWFDDSKEVKVISIN